MQTITIQTKPFFDLLKRDNISMWSLFEQMIDGSEKMLVFTDEQEQVLMHYILPSTTEQLKQDQSTFTTLFAEKLSKQAS